MKALPIACLFALLAIAGCSHSSGDVVGSWVVDPSLTGPGASPEQKGALIGFASTFHFEFKPDKTWVGAITEGTYTFDGTHLRMKTTKVLGQDVSKAPAAAGAVEMTGELSSDGKKLILHPPFVNVLPDSMNGGVPLVRKPG
ncbi:MAG TPA: hypothetical protein VHE55_14205 [Fimbriimonadaceae bacterium]|nr:hypothetical protein [Fimbriimonadaceae bacterium]